MIDRNVESSVASNKLLETNRLFCIFNSQSAGATCDCEKSEENRWILKICLKKTTTTEFSSEGVTQSKHKEGKVHFAWTYETCAISFTSCSTPFGPYWHYRVHSRVHTDITGYIYIGSYWDYRVHTLVLIHITGCTPDITGYTHWFLLTLKGTHLAPYWHYRVHKLVLTDITRYISTSPYWEYRVHPCVLCIQVLTNITGYTPKSLLTLMLPTDTMFELMSLLPLCVVVHNQSRNEEILTEQRFAGIIKVEF